MINFQPTDPYVQAAINAAVNQNQQLENIGKSEHLENMLLVFKMHGEICGLVKEREMEKKLLHSSNETLRAEIIQLERQYAEQLDMSSSIEMLAKMVVATIQSIELNFQSCKNEYPEHYHSDRVSEFALLRDKVTKLASVEVKEAPKLGITEDEGTVIQLEKAIHPISNTLLLDNVEPLFKNEIEVSAKKYEVLENETSPLRLENQKLICQKERIVEIHRENLKNRNLNSPVEKILNEVVATNEKVVWELLAKVNQGAFPGSEWSPTGAKQASAEVQRGLDKCINSGKNQMLSLIETIKTFNKTNQTNQGR